MPELTTRALATAFFKAREVVQRCLLKQGTVELCIFCDTSFGLYKDAVAKQRRSNPSMLETCSSIAGNLLLCAVLDDSKSKTIPHAVNAFESFMVVGKSENVVPLFVATVGTVPHAYECDPQRRTRFTACQQPKFWPTPAPHEVAWVEAEEARVQAAVMHMAIATTRSKDGDGRCFADLADELEPGKQRRSARHTNGLRFVPNRSSCKRGRRGIDLEGEKRQDTRRETVKKQRQVARLRQRWPHTEHGIWAWW